MSSVWFSLLQLATFSNAMLFNLQAFLQQPKGTDRLYRKDLEKQEGCDVVAYERLTEPRVTMK